MTKVCIDELTVGQVKKVTRMARLSGTEHPYQIGKNYFIRTVTFYYTGRLVRVTAHELVLEEAAWIPDTGRFTQALEKGEFAEVEPYPTQELIIGRSAVVDALLWDKPLPHQQK